MHPHQKDLKGQEFSGMGWDILSKMQKTTAGMGGGVEEQFRLTILEKFRGKLKVVFLNYFLKLNHIFFLNLGRMCKKYCTVYAIID